LVATNKAPQDGEIADRNSLKDIATQQVQVAGARWEIIKLYLLIIKYFRMEKSILLIMLVLYHKEL
jgi:hypothetical protein